MRTALLTAPAADDTPSSLDSARDERVLPLVGFLLVAGCATVSPMQTASTVDPGKWRVGAQLSTAAYCGSFVEGPLVCTDYPDGVPIPELRVNARRGLPHGADVGISLQVLGLVSGRLASALRAALTMPSPLILVLMNGAVR